MWRRCRSPKTDDMIKAFASDRTDQPFQHVHSAMEIAARLVGANAHWREAAV